jgi:pimeloyl-ACP methyl ester carboxylesterase
MGDMTEPTQIQTRHHRVNVRQGEGVHVLEMFNGESGAGPCLLAVHGTGGPGYGDTRWRLRLARRAAQRGFRVFLFDSRGTGYSDGELQDWTVSKFLDDTDKVLKWARRRRYVDPVRVGLFGFSLGSSISVLVGARRPGWVKALVAYTLPCDLDPLYLWYFERLVPGSLDEFNTRERVWMAPFNDYFKKSFLDDLKNHDVLKAAAKLTCPVLLIQVRHDKHIAAWVSNQAFEKLAGPKERLYLDQGTHTIHLGFDSTGSPTGWNAEQEEEIISNALSWFSEKL